jgi:uncharacterized membrane protein
MTEPEDGETDLASRVADLERKVVDLERRLEETAFQPRPAPAPPPAATRTPYAPYPLIPNPSRRPTVTFGASADPGQWVNRLGIALVILGAAFGFKYSIDRGWIGPALRVVSGLALSASLIAACMRLRASRPGLARMLGGGGVACAYLSIYAAFQLYGLVGHTAAFAGMSMVTAAAFFLARRDDDAALATLGAVGGFATPFLLYSGSREVPGLVGYTGFVVAACSAVFLSRGWRLLLATTVAGAWLLLGSAASQGRDAAGADALVVQVGILFAALATWWVAVMRELLSSDDAATWRPSRSGLSTNTEAAPAVGEPGWAAQTRRLVLLTPVLVFATSAWNWDADRHAAGWIAASLAVGWSGAALHLRSLGNDAGRLLSASHAAGAAVMVAFATALLLGDDARRFGLAAEALALLLASRAGDPRAARLGHLLFAAVSFEAAGALLDGLHASRAAFGAAEVSTASVVVLLLAAARMSSPPARDAYFVAAQAGLLLWLTRMLAPLPNGQVLTTAAWFAHAVALVILGLRCGSASTRRAGAFVMALTMGKLFLFDLAKVDGVWRIATFLGFGAVLLGLGYAFPALWQRGQPRRDR